MSIASVRIDEPGRSVLLTGNEAIARGAIEAGVAFCSSYPGSPSVEIAQTLFDLGKEFNIYGEWSTNEIVAMEAAAAASFAGLRAICVVKQNGLNVASDFFTSLAYSGTKGGFVLVVGDDPSAHSSTNEIDSRSYARYAEVPLLEPANFQEAREMVRYGFELSERLRSVVMMRVPTRICHARGNVTLGAIEKREKKAHYDTNDRFATSVVFHPLMHQKLARAEAEFEQSPFNWYVGPEEAKTVMITSGTGWFYSKEAVNSLGLGDRVGILKLGTTWPLPRKLVLDRLANTDDVIFVEEVDPFLEQNVKLLAAQHLGRLVTYYGQASGHVGSKRGPGVGEMSADAVIASLTKILGTTHSVRPADYPQKATAHLSTQMPSRQLAFCAGCPHRASTWAIRAALEIDGRDGFVIGDIGCYSLAGGRTGFGISKIMHCMGAGIGTANGFGQLGRFGFDQPVVALCGDSTFFHAALPALVNSQYNGAKYLLAVLDNSATAMTGFQPHPSIGKRASGEEAPAVRIEDVTQALGLPTEVGDPYDVEGTIAQVTRLIQSDNPGVLILRRSCVLVATRGQEKEVYQVDQEKCLGDGCGCERFCSRVFACPGNIWDAEAGKARIDEVVCNGCGVCASLCPQHAIVKVTPSARVAAGNGGADVSPRAGQAGVGEPLTARPLPPVKVADLDKEVLNIVIAGVGGQGNILASEMVATAALEAGYTVTVGETYGASQRGGAVMSHVRLSRKDQWGPLIPTGEADIVLGFEPLETLRILQEFGNPNTKVIVNSRPNYPITVLSGEANYPDLAEMLESIRDMAASVQVVEATTLAQQAGSSLSTNVVMVGCLAGSGLLPVPVERFQEVLNRSFSGDRLNLNVKAFTAGVHAVA